MKTFFFRSTVKTDEAYNISIQKLELGDDDEATKMKQIIHKLINIDLDKIENGSTVEFNLHVSNMSKSDT